MVRLKHEIQTSTSFTTFITARLRSSCGMCFGSKPTIVGYSPIDPDDSRSRRHLQKSSLSTTDDRRNNDIIENNNERSQLATSRHDTTIDPVETVSLAFDFLKDETDSIFNGNDGNIEHLENQQSNKPPMYRFRPPQITAITKKLFTRNNNYELTNGASQSNSSSRNDVNNHIKHHHQPHNHHHHPHQNFIQNGHRSRSETRLYYDQDQQTNMHLSPRYESRLINGSGAPISTNPLWSAASPSMAGSQPNLLSPQSLADSTPLYHQRNSQMERQMSSTHLQHSLYASYPDNKPGMITQQQENQQKRLASGQQQHNRKQATQSQYLDTNEFILRASNGQPLRNAQHPNRQVSRDYRPHSINLNGTDGTMLDVYY